MTAVRKSYVQILKISMQFIKIDLRRTEVEVQPYKEQKGVQ